MSKGALGGFAGGFASGFRDTYVTVKDQERKDAAEKRANEEYENKKTEREALRSAIADQPTSDTVPVQNFGSGSVDEGLGVQQQAISPQERGALIAQRAVARGADPMQVQQYQLGGVQLEQGKQAIALGAEQLRGAKRTNEHADEEDRFRGWLQRMQGELQSNPVAFIEQNLDAYNNATNGHLGDGLKASIVRGADGSASLVRTDKNNKVVDSTPITAQTAGVALQHLAFDRWSQLPGNFAKGIEVGQKERQIGIQEREVKVKEDDAKAKAPVYAAQARSYDANAAKDRAMASHYGTLQKAASESADARKAMQPMLDKYAQLTPEQQAGQEGQALLMQAATAGAAKSGDVRALLDSMKKPDRTGPESEWRDLEKELVKQGLPHEEIAKQREGFMVRRGFAPNAALAVIQGGVNPKTNKPLTEAEIQDFNARYPNSAVDPAKLPWLAKERQRQSRVQAIPTN